MTMPTWKMEKYRLAERYREENKSAIKGAIVFAGSSLMEMFPVEAFAKEEGPDFPVVYNRGLGGWRTEDMLATLEAQVTGLMPKRVFINIGTNDLSDPAVTIDALMERYDEILNRIEAEVPGVELVLMAYYPINYDAADEGMKACLRIRTNERIREANQAVEALAARHGARYMDFNAPLTDEQGRLKAEYTIEGMHITKEGYRAIWPEVRKAILMA
jgi:lysophospholipase L1-like esterase